MSNNNQAAGTVLVINRVFEAPRALVWQAWTETEHLMKWSCPTGFEVTFAEGELNSGGKWKLGMKSPEGTLYIMFGIYREITKPERLVFTHSWEYEDGRISPETLITIILTEQEGKVKPPCVLNKQGLLPKTYGIRMKAAGVKRLIIYPYISTIL